MKIEIETDMGIDKRQREAEMEMESVREQRTENRAE